MGSIPEERAAPITDRTALALVRMHGAPCGPDAEVALLQSLFFPAVDPSSAICMDPVQPFLGSYRCEALHPATETAVRPHDSGANDDLLANGNGPRLGELVR